MLTGKIDSVREDRATVEANGKCYRIHPGQNRGPRGRAPVEGDIINFEPVEKAEWRAGRPLPVVWWEFASTLPTAADIDRKAEGNVSVIAILMSLQDQLRPEDFTRFLDQAPNGKALQLRYHEWQRESGNPDYSYLDFAHDVLR